MERTVTIMVDGHTQVVDTWTVDFVMSVFFCCSIVAERNQIFLCLISFESRTDGRLQVTATST